MITLSGQQRKRNLQARAPLTANSSKKDKKAWGRAKGGLSYDELKATMVRQQGPGGLLWHGQPVTILWSVSREKQAEEANRILILFENLLSISIARLRQGNMEVRDIEESLRTACNPTGTGIQPETEAAKPEQQVADSTDLQEFGQQKDPEIKQKGHSSSRKTQSRETTGPTRTKKTRKTEQKPYENRPLSRRVHRMSYVHIEKLHDLKESDSDVLTEDARASSSATTLEDLDPVAPLREKTLYPTDTHPSTTSAGFNSTPSPSKPSPSEKYTDPGAAGLGDISDSTGIRRNTADSVKENLPLQPPPSYLADLSAQARSVESSIWDYVDLDGCLQGQEVETEGVLLGVDQDTTRYESEPQTRWEAGASMAHDSITILTSTPVGYAHRENTFNSLSAKLSSNEDARQINQLNSPFDYGQNFWSQALEEYGA